MIYNAVATFKNGRKAIFELEDYQVDEFLNATVKKCPYKDKKTGVMSWLPPEHLHHLIITPSLESPKCTNQKLDQASDPLI
jgi:hypothetical protein